jgi:hypothetical protein
VRKRPRLEGPLAEVVVEIVQKGGGKGERETLRGLTMGSIDMRGVSRGRTRCIVVGDKFPCWLPHCGGLGLEVVMVCVNSNEFLDVIKQQVSDTCVIHVGEIPPSFPLASVVLIDGPASNPLLIGASQSLAKIVLSTSGRRRVACLEWVGRTQLLSHELVGGVTGKVERLFIHLPADSSLLSFVPQITESPGRDASTVLMVNEYCRLLRKIPEPLEVFPLRCVNLGSASCPVYHGAGLLPASLNRSTWVLTRCLSTVEWGKRRVTRLEVLLANDYPEDVAKALLSDGGGSDEFVNSCSAVGCFITGGQPWVDACGGNEGGTITKNVKVGDDEAELSTRKRSGVPIESGRETKSGEKRMKILESNSLVGGVETVAAELGSESNSLVGGVETVAGEPALAKESHGQTDHSENGSESTSLVGDVETVANESPILVETVADESPLLKRAREELIEDLEDISVEFAGNSYLSKGPPHAEGAEGLAGIAEPKCMKPPKDLSKGPRSLSKADTEGLRHQTSGSETILKASTATIDAAKAIREQKAVKSDDADVPEHLWEEHLFQGSGWAEVWINDQERFTKACKLLKSRMLRWWKKTVTRSLNVWIDGQYPHIQEDFCELGSVVTRKGDRYAWSTDGRVTYVKWSHARMSEACIDLVPGSDAVARAANSTWFEWEDGSRPFHWRWPEFYQRVIRDGLKVHFCSEKPRYKKPQKGTKDAATRAKIIKKLKKVRTRRYIAPGFVTSLTSFFAVPKGEDDIRMVYDASVSGLNDTIWVPRFPLPTIQTHLRSVQEGTWMADLDIGEMFLNFVLHSDLRNLSGVDLTEYTDDVSELGQVIWEVWQRCAMGGFGSNFP